jgi:hypothetical protein
VNEAAGCRGETRKMTAPANWKGPAPEITHQKDVERTLLNVNNHVHGVEQ